LALEADSIPGRGDPREGGRAIPLGNVRKVVIGQRVNSSPHIAGLAKKPCKKLDRSSCNVRPFILPSSTHALLLRNRRRFTMLSVPR
jgi:hypothetical protein